MKRPYFDRRQRLILRHFPDCTLSALMRLDLAKAKLWREIIKAIGLIEKDNGNDQKTTTQTGI